MFVLLNTNQVSQSKQLLLDLYTKIFLCQQIIMKFHLYHVVSLYIPKHFYVFSMHTAFQHVQVTEDMELSKGAR